MTSLPVDSRQQQLELDLQVSTAQALLVTKGYAASAVAEAYGRARSLAEQLNRRDYLPLLLHGLWAFHLVRDELKLSATIAEQMEIRVLLSDALKTCCEVRRLAHNAALLRLPRSDQIADHD